MRAQLIGNGTLAARIPAPFAAVLQALQLQGANPTGLRALRDEDWRDLLPIIDRAHLTLPLARQDHTGLPSWVKERLGNNMADTARHWDVVQAAYREIASVLDANGLEYLVLKGFTQSPEFVPRPELRWQGDIDLYVPRGYMSPAVHSLQEIGYASCHPDEDYLSADHVPTLVRFGTWKWSGNRYDPAVPPAIDAHFCFWNDSVYSIAVPEVEEFWRRRTLRTCRNLSFPALHPVDHVGYSAMHILRGVFGAESTVHHARELATFLDRRARDDSFWKEWTAMHSPRLRSMQAIAFSMAVAWFSCSQHSAVKAEIDSLSPQVRSWIKRCGSTPLENLFRRSRDGRLLQALLVDTLGARRRIITGALAPGRIAGPAKVALFETHPTTTPTTSTLIRNYLAYPAYLLGRIWMNGSAILRFLAHACLVQLPRVRLRAAWTGDVGRTSTD